MTPTRPMVLGHGTVRVREVHKLYGSQFRGLVNTVTLFDPVLNPQYFAFCGP